MYAWSSRTWAMAALLVVAIIAVAFAGKGGGKGKPPSSPADPAIAFTHGENFNRLLVMDEDGSNATEIAGKKGSPYQHKSWSPDGGSLAYALGQRAQVWRIDVVVVDGVPEGQNDTLLRSGCYYPAWSPSTTANQIAVADSLLQSIQVISAVNGELQDTLYTAPPGSTVRDLTWKVDASEIAFFERSAAGDFAIRLLDVAIGQVTTELPTGQYIAYESLDWARHDADLLVFRGRPADGTGATRLRQLDLSSGEVSQLTDGPDDNRATWSPDGSRLAFDRRRKGANWDIWTLDLATGEENRLRRGGAFPDWMR